MQCNVSSGVPNARWDLGAVCSALCLDLFGIKSARIVGVGEVEHLMHLFRGEANAALVEYPREPADVPCDAHSAAT